MRSHLGVVSRHTGKSNFSAAMAAGIDGGATIKMTDGDGTDDALGVEHARDAVDHGMLWSAGTWVEPNGATATYEAGRLMDAANRVARPDLPYSLNCENPRLPNTPDEAWGPYVREMVDTIIDVDGRPPIIVTADWAWNHRAGASGIAFDDCWLRVMEWPKKPEAPPHEVPTTWEQTLADTWEQWIAPHQPDPVAGWDTWDVWQISCNAISANYGFSGGTTPNACVNLIKDDVWAAMTASAGPTLEELAAQIAALRNSIGALTLRPYVDAAVTSLSDRISGLAALVTDNERRKTGEIHSLTEALADQTTKIDHFGSHVASVLLKSGELEEQIAALDILHDAVDDDFVEVYKQLALLTQDLAPLSAILKAIRGQ